MPHHGLLVGAESYEYVSPATIRYIIASKEVTLIFILYSETMTKLIKVCF